jgi:hypothetical protein
MKKLPILLMVAFVGYAFVNSAKAQTTSDRKVNVVKSNDVEVTPAMETARIVNAMLSGKLSYAQQSGSYDAFYSRVTFTKQDTAGVNRLWFLHNRGTSELGKELLVPKRAGQALAVTAQAAPLEISAQGDRYQERITYAGHDLVALRAFGNLDGLEWHGHLTGLPENTTSGFPEEGTPKPGARVVTFAWDWNPANRTLAFDFRLPRSDRRDPDPDYPAVMVLALPAQVKAGQIGSNQVALNAVPQSGKVRGNLDYAFHGAGQEELLWVLGFDMGGLETLDQLRARAARARDAGYDAARLACQAWLNQALGGFRPVGRTEDEKRASAAAAWALVSNTKVGQGRFAPYLATFPSHGWYSCQYTWDSCFQSLAHYRFNPQVAADALRVLVRNQEPDGKIPQFVCTTWNRPGESQPPLIAWSAWNLHRMGTNRALLGDLFDPLVRNLDWWMRERDYNHDGVVEYQAALESGWDDSPRWDKGRVSALDLNAFLIVHTRCLARMAAELGRPEEAARLSERARHHAQRVVEYLYCKEDGLFYDRRLEDGAWVKVLTPACFLPLWAGVPLPEAQARAMIEKYLLAPEHFFGEYPFPVVAYSDPEYRAGAWWRGPIWVNISYLMLEVLDAYGYAAQRDQAADRLVAMITRNLRPHELFDSKTGQGLGVVDYGWTSASMLRLLDFRTRNVFEATER